MRLLIIMYCLEAMRYLLQHSGQGLHHVGAVVAAHLGCAVPLLL